MEIRKDASGRLIGNSIYPGRGAYVVVVTLHQVTFGPRVLTLDLPVNQLTSGISLLEARKVKFRQHKGLGPGLRPAARDYAPAGYLQAGYSCMPSRHAPIERPMAVFFGPPWPPSQTQVWTKKAQKTVIRDSASSSLFDRPSRECRDYGALQARQLSRD